MHGAGIVGQKEAAGRGQIDELPQAGLAGEVSRLGSRPPQQFRHGLAQRAFRRRAEHQDGCP